MEKKVLIIVLLSVAALLAFAFKDKFFKSAIGATPKIPNSNDSGKNDLLLIKKGSRGEKVRFMQSYINEYHGGSLITDGIWGNKTQNAFMLMVSKVDFIASKAGLTENEYEFIAPHENYLRGKYFNRK